MKVLIVSQYFWPENFRVNEAARELAARGHEVTVLTGQPNYPSGSIFPDYRRNPDLYRHWNNVDIVRVPLVPRGSGRARLALNYLSFAATATTIGVVKLLRKRFDVILTFQYSPPTVGLPAVVLRAIRHVPHVVWVQDLWPESLEASGVSSRLVIGMTSRFIRWAYSRSDHLIGQSRAFLHQLRTRSPVSTPVSYLPNWPAAPTSAPQKSGNAKSTFDIYFLGNLGQAQDLPAVMSAARRLACRRDLHWHFVGDGSMAGWLRRQIVAMQLNANVHLHDAVPPERLRPFIDDADALLVSLRPDPLYAMTVPSKVQSYLSSGRPIVAMLDGEGAELLAESGAGLVAPAGDPAGLAKIVQRLAEMSPADREAMGQAGVRYCAQHFDFDMLIRRLEGVLSEVQLSSRRPHKLG